MVDKNDLEIYDNYNKKKYKIYVAKNTEKIKYMIKTFGFLKINWDGVKSVLIHSLWLAGLTLAFYWLGILKDLDFGAGDKDSKTAPVLFPILLSRADRLSVVLRPRLSGC